MRYLFVSVCMLIALGAPAVWAKPEPVPKDEESRWLRWLLPLPKHAAIPAKLVVQASGVGLRVTDPADDLLSAAAAELGALFKDKAATELHGEAFELLLGLCNEDGDLAGISVPGAEKLAGLPNRDQAYCIRAIGANRLVLTALDGKGVFYAARTLCQLIESHFEGDRVSLPLAEVLDWPDLEERGEWGGSAESDIVWLAKYKMNLIETHVKLKVSEDGKGFVEADTERIELGRRHALKVVPIITHLDHLRRTGLYDVYPELKGKGDGAVDDAHPSLCAPCASNPKFFQVLADWMGDLAGQRGVTDVCAWLSEHHIRCGCERCSKVGQYALEARGLVKGWRKARETHPGLRLRILLTQGSYTTNDKVIAECPPEVGVTYYDGGRTYNSSRDPMIYPVLEDFAGQGRWLGCYPQLTASWRIVCPWSAPQFIQYRMQEFVDKKLHCLCGYATPDNRLYELNVLAAAEWAWNAHGRSPEEFALAWATRRGLSDPEAAARWAVMLGPVGWDVYGSGIPYPHLFDTAAAMVARRAAPKWGSGMFRYFPDAQHLDNDLATCDEALRIAQKLGEPELIGETASIQGYVHMLGALYGIANAYHGDAGPDRAMLEALQEGVNRLAHAAYRTCEALNQWESAAKQHDYSRGRFCDTVNVTKKTAQDVGKTLAALGIEDPGPMLFGCEVGRWATDDFEPNEDISKTLDVSAWIDGPGAYAVEFAHTGGYNGLRMHRAALVNLDAEPAKIISSDKHEGVAKPEKEATEYVLKLDQHEPNARYGLTVDISGVRSSDKPENMRGCNGAVFLRKVRDPDEQLPAGQLPPPG